ncbi:hypothetical protein FOPG_18980 [Fusarium oxysporum f. sp. conglutinans race 2 54008]|uniref:Uncharacterized protein n=2 Tax=Fusarium oxysporum f. sp. conglutinans TaxID=100902 RepID=F9FHZ0_FUSOF|nr:hypothetical protein FOXB_06019 [Fusarium oxysporum f. sp. conglutinans Fo5176]EXL64766.1 hypothetical protein FOPG_18980 [Fusarium oxysporum f. sp. conglutinans race 2 54008]
MIKIGRPLPPKSNTDSRPSKRLKTTTTHPSHHEPRLPTSPSLLPVPDDTPSPPSPSKPVKSPKPSPPSFTEVDSLRKQAEPYRLAVAELPIHLLHSSWSRGNNRPLDRNHVAHLCRSFQNGGLARRAEEHYIQVSCSAAAVDKMMMIMINAIPDTDQSTVQNQHQHLLSFRNWADFNDERPELMAGQHRVEALKDYVKQTTSDPSDLWWICEFYDKDALPVELDIKLRVNRRGLALPDTHGQIWLQLVSAFDRDPTLFSTERNGNKKGIEKRMLDILCLTSEARFPISRLVTLWRNERWRPRITRWCRTSLGRATFNISKWYQIAGYRLDDHMADLGCAIVLYEQYWFDTFYQTLETLRALPASAPDSIKISDWTMLACSLKSDTYDAADVHQVFYPKEESNNNGDNNPTSSAPSTTKPAQKTSRRSGFLSLLDKEAYDSLCRHLKQNLTLRFPDVQPLLQIKKEEGEVMAQVMDHVVRWINTQPADIIGLHENNKPLRREDLVPAIKRLKTAAHGDDWWAQLREDDDVNGADDVASWLDLRSRTLERQVLDYVRSHMAEFRNPSTKPYLDLMPEEHDEHYAERFSTGDLWTGLFNIVQHAVGPAFRPVWEDYSISERVGADNAIHQPRSEKRHRPPASIITRAICSQLENIPEVKENPALRGVYASSELGAYIDHAVLAWASDRCRKAVENNESDEGHPWSSEALRAIQVAYQGYERILAGMTSATAISEHDDDQQQQQRQLASLLPPEERISHVPNEVLPQQGAVSSSSHIIKQPPSSQGFVPISMADRVQQDRVRHDSERAEIIIAAEEDLLHRMQQRQPSRYPQQQPPSSPLSAGNAKATMPPLLPAQKTALRSPHHRGGTQGRNAVNHGYQPPPQKSYVTAEVGRPLQILPKGAVGGGRVNQSPVTRKTLPNGRPSPGQSQSTRARQPRNHRQDDTLSSQPPPWTNGPVATARNRR